MKIMSVLFLAICAAGMAAAAILFSGCTAVHDLSGFDSKIKNEVKASELIPWEAGLDFINWADYANKTPVELNKLTIQTGVYLKHNYQLDAFLLSIPSNIRGALEMLSFAESIEDNESAAGYVEEIARLKEKYASVLIEKQIREKDAFYRDPVGTTYYVDCDAGDDSQNGLTTGTAWRSLRRYTTLTARTAGDIAYVRAGTFCNNSADLAFDEDGTTANHIFVIGAVAGTLDPWGDASSSKPKVSFLLANVQAVVNGDDFWEFHNLIFENSTDNAGTIAVTNSRNIIFRNCTFQGVNAGSEGLQATTVTNLECYNCEFYTTQAAAFQLNSGNAYLDNPIISPGVAGTTYGIYTTLGFLTIKDATITNCDTGIYISGGVLLGARVNNTCTTATNIQYGSLIRMADTLGNASLQYADSYTSRVSRTEAYTRPGGSNASANWSLKSTVNPNSPASLTSVNEKFEYEANDFNIYLPAGTHNISIYARGYGWSGFPTASQLYLEAKYINDSSYASYAKTRSSETLSDNTNWVGFNVTVTPQQAGWVGVTLYSTTYNTSAGLYVDPEPVVTSS